MGTVMCARSPGHAVTTTTHVIIRALTNVMQNAFLLDLIKINGAIWFVTQKGLIDCYLWKPLNTQNNVVPAKCTAIVLFNFFNMVCVHKLKPHVAYMYVLCMHFSLRRSIFVLYNWRCSLSIIIGKRESTLNYANMTSDLNRLRGYCNTISTLLKSALWTLF